ncbi:hypothetical protein GMRT_10285 [Giardia muris]|uniref:HAD family hydrolase n=1 Tax=Giardia muris TaxID=5742 RepID=A0A4Z1TA65_GIAMU|nr:hypothetical protein GMRT_10285 [Giardia muris]|eukprot:TNJ29421.1 hypothetical protein GMRT_10285 [Giardia muris]
MQWAFFDIDGVLVHECGVASVGYAFQLEAIKGGQIPTDYTPFFSIDSELQVRIRELRAKVKGFHPVRKIKALANLLEVPLQVDPVDLAARTMDVQRAYIIHRFTPEEYIIPGARDLVKTLSNRYRLSTLTANTADQARWILQYVGLDTYFTAIIGYEPSDVHMNTKADMLRAFADTTNVDFAGSIVLGDGVPDIRAGKELGCRTVGIYATEEDRILLEQACFLVATGAGYDRIPSFLDS